MARTAGVLRSALPRSVGVGSAQRFGVLLTFRRLERHSTADLDAETKIRRRNAVAAPA